MTQRLADRIKQHVPTSMRKNSGTAKKPKHPMCKNNSKINCDLAVGQHYKPKMH